MVLEEVLLKTKKPLYSIGGINNENIINLKKMGYKKFAISNGVYAFEEHEIKNIIKINNEGN